MTRRMLRAAWMETMMKAKVFLGSTARHTTHNHEKLMRKAEAVAAGLTLPPGIEFARFEHEGKTYALSSRLSVEVALLENRVPNVVLRSGGGQRRATARR